MMYTMASGLSALPLLSLITLAEARSFWASSPATFNTDQSTDENLIKSGYPLGNGKLGAIPFGEPGAEKIALNIDSLWSGGPFESSSYAGGNPSSEKNGALPGIRDWIFQQGTGNVTALLGSGANFGSYRALANLTITIDHGKSYKNYKRTLDLERGIYQTKYEVDGVSFGTTIFCSYPAQACVYNVVSNKPLPAVTATFENLLVSPALVNTTCIPGKVRFSGVTQAGPPLGMKFDAIARPAGGHSNAGCAGGGFLKLPLAKDRQSLTLVIGAETNFDQTRGTAAHKYSFQGEDPAERVESTTRELAKKTYEDLLSKHVEDYQALFGAFSLDLPDVKQSAMTETKKLITSYKADDVAGDPFLENLLFDYGRYLLITSSRENSLPSNLQGRWTEQLNPAWSADYHANINLQMNYWMADQTGLARTQHALWNYMEQNWVPRGSETAKLLYGAPGWVVHNEMNIFGHTGMKDSATWANYPAAAAWMMQHVWDNFEYTQDVSWLKKQGYPLIKGVAQFWLSQLQKDAFFNDGTLVVNPCNSAEHGPTTFGCTHYQQLIFQVFDAVLASSSLVEEKDTKFLKEVTQKLAALDHGVHISNWGGIKEWKLPDSYGQDGPNTHRHLSHLVGWYPGYSVASFDGGYTNKTIQDAVEKTLKTRGPGNADDADAGWEKVWRSACWARLNNTEQAHYELRYAIDSNFANNGFDMYQALLAPFQIDGNFGLGGAMLSMLVVDMPTPHDGAAASSSSPSYPPLSGGGKKPRTVVLGPAIPKSWGGGKVKNLRLRGGRSVDFSWNKDGKVDVAKLKGSGKPVILVNVDGKVLARS